MRRWKGSKTALVLAGGGISGAVYEIGALRAMDDLLIDRTVNDFDIYVGTSAGSLVGAFVSQGVSPEDMLTVLNGTNKQIQSIRASEIFNLNIQDYLKTGLRLPAKLIQAWINYLTNFPETKLFDLLWAVGDTFPEGIYDGRGLAEFIRMTYHQLGLQDHFQDLQRELFIIATELDTGERAIFGRGYLDAPISTAVAASSALPLVYKPVRIGERDYVDGGLRGLASIDLAIEHGANLVVCINPMVPINYSKAQPSRYIREQGLPSIAGQTFRILTHAGIHYHIKQLKRSHPEVDIILIEPKPEDYQMFENNLLNYASITRIARHGFESVTLDLAIDYYTYKEILNRHGIPITRQLVIEELSIIESSNYDPEVIRQVLEANRKRCGQSRRGTPICQLTRTLAELEMMLSNVSA